MSMPVDEEEIKTNEMDYDLSSLNAGGVATISPSKTPATATFSSRNIAAAKVGLGLARFPHIKEPSLWDNRLQQARLKPPLT